MRGDQDDFVARLRLTLPTGWFNDDAPVLKGVLNGMAAAWAWLFALLGQVRVQSRLQSVSGGLLDLACSDFFGLRLRRRAGEDDDALRGRLQEAMHRTRGTRAGLVAAAAQAGFAIEVFEPARPADTGAYNVAASLAWGVAGGWGSLQMPLACLVTATEVAPVEALGPALEAALPAGGTAWVRMAG